MQFLIRKCTNIFLLQVYYTIYIQIYIYTNFYIILKNNKVNQILDMSFKYINFTKQIQMKTTNNVTRIEIKIVESVFQSTVDEININKKINYRKRIKIKINFLCHLLNINSNSISIFLFLYYVFSSFHLYHSRDNSLIFISFFIIFVILSVFVLLSVLILYITNIDI